MDCSLKQTAWEGQTWLDKQCQAEPGADRPVAWRNFGLKRPSARGLQRLGEVVPTVERALSLNRLSQAARYQAFQDKNSENRQGVPTLRSTKHLQINLSQHPPHLPVRSTSTAACLGVVVPQSLKEVLTEVGGVIEVLNTGI